MEFRHPRKMRQSDLRMLAPNQPTEVVRDSLALVFGKGADHVQFLVAHQDFQLIRTFRRHVPIWYLHATRCGKLDFSVNAQTRDIAEEEFDGRQSAWFQVDMGTDPKRDIEILALFAAMPIRSALEADLVTFAADAYFEAHGEAAFRMNPANTLPYRALTHLRNGAILMLSEALRGASKFHPVDEDLDLEALTMVRDMIAHPVKAQWRKPDRQVFAESHHHGGVRVGLVWTIAKKFDAALATYRVNRGPLANVPIHSEMAEMLRLILTASAKEPAQIHDAASLLEFLKRVKDRYITVRLEAFPRGINPADEPKPITVGARVKCIGAAKGLEKRNLYTILEHTRFDHESAVPIVRVVANAGVPPVDESSWFAATLFRVVDIEDDEG